jgi:hypothetical protein
VLQSLKQYDRQQAVARGDVGSSLANALGQLQRARRVAAAGCAGARAPTHALRWAHALAGAALTRAARAGATQTRGSCCARAA